MVNRTPRGVPVAGRTYENSSIGFIGDGKSPMTRLGERVVIMGDCWVVDGEPDRYHSIHVGGGSSVPAHRYVYQEVNDVALLTMEHVHHKCETKGCIKPDHLQVMLPHQHVHKHRTGVDPEHPAAPSNGRPAWWADVDG